MFLAHQHLQIPTSSIRNGYKKVWKEAVYVLTIMCKEMTRKTNTLVKIQQTTMRQVKSYH